MSTESFSNNANVLFASSPEKSSICKNIVFHEFEGKQVPSLLAHLIVMTGFGPQCSIPLSLEAKRHFSMPLGHNFL
jgi:hypothetical protein